jgi:hypothetical protein
LVVSIFGLGYAGVARAAGPVGLQGETVYGGKHALVYQASCDSSGVSTVTYSVTGPAEGPYEGTFSETGTITVGPETVDSATAPYSELAFEANAMPIGVVANLDATFTITTATGTVTGTRHLTSYGDSPNEAFCFPPTVVSGDSFFGCGNALSPVDGATAQAVWVDAYESYSAQVSDSIQGSSADSGVSFTDLGDETVESPTSGCGSYVYETDFLAPATPVADANGDGVIDTLQPAGTAAGSFVDSSLTPPTTGSITNANGLAVSVQDAPAASDGVQVTVGAGSGAATLSVCGGFTVRINAGSTVVLTCGCVIVQVISGSADVPLGASDVAVPAGGKAKVTDATGGAYTVEDLGSTSIGLTTAGHQTTLAAGSAPTATTSFSLTPATLAGLTGSYAKTSAKYAALKPLQQAAVNVLINAVSAAASSIKPTLKPAQKAPLVAAFTRTAAALAKAGWLTSSQLQTLDALAAQL